MCRVVCVVCDVMCLNCVFVFCLFVLCVVCFCLSTQIILEKNAFIEFVLWCVFFVLLCV